MSAALRIGSRGSRLALWQAGWIRDRLEAAGRPARIVVIRTSGDRLADRALASIGGKGVFVKEIEDALLAGRVDLAVHSYKDLPTDQPDGLAIVCVPAREDPRDVLVGRTAGPASLEALPRRAVVGTGSPRRACQIRAVRPDLVVTPVRGNVDTRLEKLRRGDCDALVLAAAGLRRLGVADPATPLPPETMLPAVGQGALAIEARAGDGDAAALLAPLHDAATAAAVAAERALLRGLGGGCQAPIAALGEISGAALSLRALVADVEGGAILRDALSGPVADPGAVGAALASRLLGRGAAALVRRGQAPGPDPP